MRCGIDFGTTRIVAAAVDRGNYPVIAFEDDDGDLIEFLPSVVALDDTDEGDGARLRVGWDALAAADRGAPLVRSVKRMLADPGVTASTPVHFGARRRPLGTVLATLASATIEGIRDALDLSPDEPVDAVVGVPANAGSAQRLLTLGAFSNAGVRVDALVNEPSAAAFEYTHRHPRSLTSRRTDVVVYDLGGGTFDASLVHIDGVDHEVRRSLGLSRLGGDDLDTVLAELILDRDPALADRAGLDPDRLQGACRSAKERIVPQSRRVVVELGDDDITVPVDDFFEAATPLITATIEAMAPLISAGDGTLADTEIAGLYLVGGASELPLVPRLLRERFGRRVHRSPYPSASTAIGLAIAADPDSGYRLRDRLARGIGVFRELDHGREVGFDPLVAPDAALSADGTITVTRRYRAAHNIGWFRFVEYRGLDGGEPRGDLLPVAELRMPFAAELQDGRPLAGIDVERIPDGPEVEERVDVDENGIATFRIRDLGTGFEASVVAARDSG